MKIFSIIYAVFSGLFLAILLGTILFQNQLGEQVVESMRIPAGTIFVITAILALVSAILHCAPSAAEEFRAKFKNE